MFDSRTNRNAGAPMGKRIPKPEETAPKAASEPVVPEVKRNRRWMALGVVLLLVSLVTGLTLTRGSEIRAVEVSGIDRTTEEQVLKAARIPTGVPLDSAGFVEAIRRVERLPYVRRASVQTRASGTVRIAVEERIPVARLVSESGRAMVDAEGVMMPVLAGRTENVPDLRGFRADVGDTLTSPLFRTALAFLQELPKHDLARLTLTEITADPQTGIVAHTTERRVKVLMGKEPFGERLTKWDAFYAQIVPVKGIQRFRLIDLRYRDQLITHETNR